MTITIDKAGRLVLPKEIRDEMGLGPNSELEIIFDGIEVRLKKPESETVLKKKGRFLVIDSEWVGESDPIKLIHKSRNSREDSLF